MPKRDQLLSRFVNKTWLRSICNVLFALLATTAFVLALLFGKNVAKHNVFFNAFAAKPDMTAVALLVLFGVYALMSAALILIQFKRPSSSVLLSSVQFAVLLLAATFFFAEWFSFASVFACLPAHTVHSL